MRTLFALDFPLEEKHQPSDDSIHLLRETPAWKVRDRWSLIRKHRDELLLHMSISDPTTPAPAHPGPKAGRWMELLGIMICRSLHREPSYSPGSLFSECRCGRKYAVPFAISTHSTIKPMFPVHLEPDVYVNDEPFPKPATRTKQAPCRHGTQGVY